MSALCITKNPFVNSQLISVLEILSRFAVPAFFFLSAFGLFYHTSVNDPFSYKDFRKRRFQVVLYPYIVWSLFYLYLYRNNGAQFGNLHPGPLLVNPLFGNSMYHLYFMVILVWFYVLMPLWRVLVRWILKAPIPWLVILFAIQLGVDFYIILSIGGLGDNSLVILQP